MAPVVYQLVGDGPMWDRVAIAQYRDRLALIEMSSADDFAEAEGHKDAGMDFTIVMATFRVEGDPVAAQMSAAGSDRRLLLQVVGDAASRDMAHGLESIRIGRLWIEDRFLRDERTLPKRVVA